MRDVEAGEGDQQLEAVLGDVGDSSDLQARLAVAGEAGETDGVGAGIFVLVIVVVAVIIVIIIVVVALLKIDCSIGDAEGASG